MGASAGRVLLIPKGDWNARTTYTGLDWVRHNGAAWVCKNTCTNIEPTLENADNWQMMARDGDGVTADTAMSDTSTNAVQNKVIKSYVDNSITGISDMTGATATQNGAHGLVPAPQAGDEKKVLLGDGTWGAIDDKFSFSDHDTATSGTSFTDAEDGNMIVTDWTKNLLNPTLETTTLNGITCTNNGDGTYTLNGTASEVVFLSVLSNISIKDKKVKLVGGAIGGNYDDGYALYLDGTKDGVEITKYKDTGDGAVIDANDKLLYYCYIVVRKNVTVSNLVFKPMLTTDLNATYDDFVPYGGYEIQSCGKNLLNTKIGHGGYSGGITSEIKSDGSYSFKGTATSGSINIWILGIYGHNLPTVLSLEPGTYFVKGVLLYKDTEQIANGNYGSIVNFTERQDITGVRTLDAVVGKTYDEIYYPIIALSNTDTPFEPYVGETITVTNDTESQAFGLKSHKGITNIISPGNVKCVYPTNESGKGVLDAMYNNELSKRKNAIFRYSTKNEYDTAVANNEIPDGATVIKDYDD